MDKMKTAVCFTGIGRSILALEDYGVFRNLYANVISGWQGDVDVYCVFGDQDETARTAAKIFHGNVPNCKVILVPQDDLDIEGIHFPPIGWAGKECPPSAQSLAKFLNKRLILRDALRQSGVKYDRVVVSRDDVVYRENLASLTEELDLNDLWIPTWGHWSGGYNDRLAISNPDIIDKYLSAWEHRREVKEIHIESFYRHVIDTYIKRDNLSFFHTEFFRVRPSGKIQPEQFETAWCTIVNPEWRKHCYGE